ncbi:hypothetical protein RDI58_010152 [Solanum bulbocastanum]|uniref:Uncharacterized protein n=1 Tax=Solanum bulbocastanum TaxID=147425 RepID=A0AAN8TSY3_SOLBU
MNLLHTRPARAYSNKDKDMDKQLWNTLIDQLIQHQFSQNPTAGRQCFRLLVVFACHGTVILNASSRLVEIDYPFADTIWLRTVPCWHDSLEQFRWGDQV